MPGIHGGKIPVTGRTPDVAPYKGKPGCATFRNRSDACPKARNHAWIDSGVARGVPLKVVSKPTVGNIDRFERKEPDYGPVGYELQRLSDDAYAYRDGWMLPPGWA